MDKIKTEEFLLKARSKTYANAKGRMHPLLPGSVQYEFIQDDFLYRDIYFIGNGIFSGIETIYLAGKPVWSMSYFGDFSKMTEEQTDSMLRTALLDLEKQTRIYNEIMKDYGDFKYVCNGTGSIDKLSGEEEILVDKMKVYDFRYSGGYIG